MRKFFMMALAAALLSVSYSCKKGVEGSDAEKLDDRATLERVFQALNGEGWQDKYKDNWCSEAPLSDWAGVKTDDAGRVIELRLDNNDVHGQLPAEVINLSELQTLSITLNNNGRGVKNPIPAEAFRLPKLKSLALRVMLSYDAPEDEFGHLPETVSLPAIEHLTLNRVLGDYHQLAQMKTLKSITIKYSATDIPDEIGQLSELSDIFWENADKKECTRPLTAELGKLSNLKVFRYYPEGSKDEGVPEVLKQLTKLENLQASKLSLKDNELPAWLFEMPNLAYVSVEESNLTGAIPETVGSNGKLRSLSLYNNPKLTGAVPASIAKNPNFYNLNLRKTGVSTNLPASLKALKEYSKFSDRIFK